MLLIAYIAHSYYLFYLYFVSMKILKWGIVGALIAQVIYLFTKDAKLKKEIEKSQWWKKAQVLGKEIVDLNKDLIDKAKHTDYEKKWNTIKDLAHSKEKDLQKHIKKLESYADSLWEKKVNDIIKEIQKSSEWFVKKIEEEAVSVKKSIVVKKNAVAKKVPTKKTAAKKVVKKKAPVKKATPKKPVKKVAKKK